MKDQNTIREQCDRERRQYVTDAIETFSKTGTIKINGRHVPVDKITGFQWLYKGDHNQYLSQDCHYHDEFTKVFILGGEVVESSEWFSLFKAAWSAINEIRNSPASVMQQ